MKKRFISCLAATLLLLLLLTSCGGNDVTTTEPNTTTTTTEDPGTVPPPPQKQTYDLTLDSPVKVMGRSVKLSKGIALDHSASSIEFQVVGGGDVSLKGTSLASQTFFAVYIDGVRQVTRVRFQGTQTQKIAAGLAEGTHTIELVRQNEAKDGGFTALSLELSAATLGAKPADRDLYIESIGDSITAGQGVWCKFLTKADQLTPLENQTGVCVTDGSESSPETDGSYTYAALAARALGADYSTTAYSGIGVARTWGAGIIMPDYYQLASQKRNSTQKHDFASARKPDLVIINLGTNDGWLINNASFSGALTKDTYKEQVKKMINLVRTSYNDQELPIVWATGLMGSALSDWAKEAITELGGEGAKIYQINTLTEGRSGHNGHPTWKQQQVAADQLKTFLESKGLVG